MLNCPDHPLEGNENVARRVALEKLAMSLIMMRALGKVS